MAFVARPWIVAGSAGNSLCPLLVGPITRRFSLEYPGDERLQDDSQIVTGIENDRRLLRSWFFEVGKLASNQRRGHEMAMPSFQSAADYVRGGLQIDECDLGYGGREGRPIAAL